MVESLMIMEEWLVSISARGVTWHVSKVAAERDGLL